MEAMEQITPGEKASRAEEAAPPAMDVFGLIEKLPGVDKLSDEYIDTYTARLSAIGDGYLALRDSSQVKEVLYRIKIAQALSKEEPRKDKTKWREYRAKNLGKSLTTIRDWVRAYERALTIKGVPLSDGLTKRLFGCSIAKVPAAIDAYNREQDPDYVPPTKPRKREPTDAEFTAKWAGQINTLLDLAWDDPRLHNALYAVALRIEVRRDIFDPKVEPAKPEPQVVECQSVEVLPPISGGNGDGNGNGTEISLIRLDERYRPQRLSEIVGCGNVVDILASLARQRLARPILLCGPTGTGKTSLAQIYAASIACEGDRPDGFEPCGQCPSCRSGAGDAGFVTHFTPGAVEQIAASAFKNGKKAIESVLETMNYGPSALIVDEAECLGDRHRLLHRLGRDLGFPVLMTSTTPEAFDPQFRGRCLSLDTTLADETTLRNHVVRVSVAEGHPVTDGEVDALIARLAEAGTSGQIRNALVLLEERLMLAGGEQSVH